MQIKTLEPSTELEEHLEPLESELLPPEEDDFLTEDLSGSFDDWSGGGSSPADKHADLFKELTNFSPFLKQIVAEWLGMIWDDKKEGYIRDANVEPMMNMKGSRWAVNFLRVYARNNNIITNLDEDSYIHLMEDIIDVAVLNVGTRSEEFEIKNDGDCLTIWNQIIHAAELVLIGAGGEENYSKLLSTAVQRTEHVQVTDNPYQKQEEKRPGFMKRIGNVLGGK